MAEHYFNYFTEVEEHFQRARGTGLFLMSPLDWALVEAWKNSGIPLEAVLRGIDAAFEKWRAKPSRARTQNVNAVAYCAQAVAAEAQALAEGGSGKAARNQAPAPFPLADVCAYVDRNAALLHKAGQPESAESLAALNLEELFGDLEQLEQRLSAIEEKLVARLRAGASDEWMFEARRSLDLQLKPYRGKMSVEQLSMLEKQFMDRRLLDAAGLPRISLFYLGTS